MRMQPLLRAMLALTLVACAERELRPLNPCTIQGNATKVKIDNIENVDLLFMVDNSNSMANHQGALSEQLPNMVRILASGDLDGDGRVDFPPVRSLNVGVVTSDMGTGGFSVTTCSNADFGDDGVLRTAGNVARSGCVASYPSFQNFEPERDGDPVTFANAVACVAVMGTNGCGFEQQLEAVLKAVTPSTSDIRFINDSRGHADGQNAGFLREKALLAAILVTDEDDCTIRDPQLTNGAPGAPFPGNLNLRCYLHGTEEYARTGRDPATSPVASVERFVRGLLAVKDDPDMIIYAAITGIPTDVNPDPDEAIDYDAILNHPLMREEPDPATITAETPGGTQLRPSCDRVRPGAATRERAFPPRRIVGAARQLEQAGANVVLQTICQDSFEGALREIVRKIGDALGATCLPRQLVRDRDGEVNCDVLEALPPGRSCDEVPGRVFRRTELDESGRSVQVCEVVQLPVVGGVRPTGEGWYYETAAENEDVATRCPPERQQRVRFNEPPLTGSTIRLECLQTVGDTGGEAGAVGIGSDCATGCDVEARGFARRLTCQADTNTCQPPCETAADCAGGYVCHRDPESEDPQAYCVNPTC
ncbi:MAG: hypothetical protein KF901_30360 [Myxococcales bacterium]|nr:hypothetical protein [Myxococcales bacterium]